MQNIMITKISKQGTSLGVVIPKVILNAYHWQRGDVVIFGVADNDTIYVKRLSDKELHNLIPHEK